MRSELRVCNYRPVRDRVVKNTSSDEATGKLVEQMPPIPSITKFVKITLDVDFTEVMIGALEEPFGVRYR